MDLISFPNPVSWFESARNAGLERQEINALVSALYSAQLTFLWESGKSLPFWKSGGTALQKAAVAQYLTLNSLESRNFLTLTLPKDMLNPDILSQFQTESKSK